MPLRIRGPAGQHIKVGRLGVQMDEQRTDVPNQERSRYASARGMLFAALCNLRLTHWLIML